VTSDRRKPFWLFPNLLSIDAPLVAVAWLYIFSRTWRMDSTPPWYAHVALGLTVWVIYVADRLLDVSLRGSDSDRCEERHRFHAKHRKTFLISAGAASLIAVLLVVFRMPFAIYSYFLIAGFFVVAFFVLSLFSNDDPHRIPYAKNVVAGFAFAYGTAMTVHVFLPSLGGGSDMGGAWELLKFREFICFGVLCVLNISAIDLWEHANRSSDPEVKAADEIALSLPLTLLGAAALVFALLDHEMTTRPFFYAILTGAALLQILNRTRNRFSMESLRVLADAALLVPLLVFLAFPQN